MGQRAALAQDQGAPDYEAALLRCAAGHEGAVAGIYLTERHRLRKVARGIVRDRDNADDVVHDAFVQILRDARSFDPARGSARAWIYAIVRNTALRRRRYADREFAVEDDALSAIRERNQTLGESDARMAEYASLRSCLESLEPRRRASLILAIIDGRTHAEIAAYLGVPIGTVKAWIRRELVALRERLK